MSVALESDAFAHQFIAVFEIQRAVREGNTDPMKLVNVAAIGYGTTYPHLVSTCNEDWSNGRGFTFRTVAADGRHRKGSCANTSQSPAWPGRYDR